MSKAEKTRQFIVEKTAPLFNTKGYEGTSLSDMTAATGLTKGSIYGNFDNKEEVALAAFQYNVDRLTTHIVQAMASEPAPTGKLIAFVEFFRDQWGQICDSGGCPLMNTAIEADDALPFLKRNVQAGFQAWAELLATTIEQGKQTGEFSQTIPSTPMAYTIIMLLEGGIMMAKTMDSALYLNLALDQIRLIIKTDVTQ